MRFTSILGLTATWLLAQAAPSFPPPRSLGSNPTGGRHMQRAMHLMATSTAQQPNTVRILFYGQSITEQAWWTDVADDLRRRFPHARLVIENRAIGGHAAQLLVKTAEADLYPFYPDLVIFHVYGDHRDYESIIRRIRERTTADVALQTDHLGANDSLNEETDPARLTPANWAPWMNYVFLPGIARRYQVELVDQRNAWKQYLRDYGLAPQALLRDGVHLNAQGEYLMAEIVKAALRYDPAVSSADWKDRVRDYRIG